MSHRETRSQSPEPRPERVDNGEFAPGVDEAPDRLSRRRMIQIMGASAALAAGGAGCERKPRRKIVSTTSMPEYRQPGEPLYYASTWLEGRHPQGILIKTVDGRPIKIEGNPLCPTNGHASTADAQAAVLGLYDPDRLRAPMLGEARTNWEDADRQALEALRQARSTLLVTGPNLGPSERALVAQFLAAKPSARHLVYDSLASTARQRAHSLVYGPGLALVPRYDQARVILSLDCDFLGAEGHPAEAMRRFAEGRRPTPERPEMSRLYCIEGGLSLTGANADLRLRLRPSRLAALARALLGALQQNRPVADFAKQNTLDATTLEALVADLREHRGQALVVAGEGLPEALHALVALLNQELQAPGNTLELDPAAAPLPATPPAEIRAAFEAAPDLAILLGVNPVHDFPGGGFAELLGRAKYSIAHSLYLDETASRASLALPSAHNLEAWNDTELRQGLFALCQPVLAPLFGGRQEAESLLVWTRALNPTDLRLADVADWHGYLKTRWQREVYPSVPERPANFERFWEKALHDGILRAPAAPRPAPVPNLAAARQIAATAKDAPAQGLELRLTPHFVLADGRFANRAWLQELPDPVTKIVWDNAALIAPATAEELGLAQDDMVEITANGAKATLPVFVQKGMAAGVLAAALGYGREKAGSVGDAVGANLFPLVGDEGTLLLTGVELRPTGGSHPLVVTQKYADATAQPPRLERPSTVVEGTLEQYRKDPEFARHVLHVPHDVAIHSEFDYSQREYKWGMTIDLTRCTGCSHCVVACQAENNIPVVGKDQVARGREMHWMRLDRYYDGDEDNLLVRRQPMLCQHCENAPCENVCPVAATTHSPDGINEMTYNRCVGTRYCSNNCPYKVRRWNFHDYPRRFIGRDNSQQLAYNPQVTVRSVGIMEKCTFCLQRITAAKYEVKRSGKPLDDGQLKAACQQACPAGAIQFGNLNDPKHKVAALWDSERRFQVLEELNTAPRVTYLARIANPAPGTPADEAFSAMARNAHHGGGHGMEHGESHGNEDSHDPHEDGGHHG